MSRHNIIVEGTRACFTRPEMKVERVSYDVPTPGALEGMLKCFFWKPAIRYRIDKIVVYNPINFTALTRNEVSKKLALGAVRDKMKDPLKDISIYTNDCRSQRSSVILKDVKYGISFHFEMTGIRSDHEHETYAKYHNIITHRLSKGKCFRQPVFGCREFPVDRIELVDRLDIENVSREIADAGDVDLGYMLHHMEFVDKGIGLGDKWSEHVFSDEAFPVYYRPHMINGVIDVAKYSEDTIC